MKILVIRFKNIGDVLLSSTICSSLRKSFPDAKIDFLVHAASAPLFDHHPAIDTLISLSAQERRNPIRYVKKIWSISLNQYDIVIDATSTAKSELISLFCRGAKYRIGRYKKGRGLFYTDTVKKFNGDKIQQRLSMLQPLIDQGLPIQKINSITVRLTDKERDAALELLIKAGVNLEQAIFAFSVSSKLEYRQWNINYMKQVAEHCLSVHKAQIVLLTGMPHEKPVVEWFKNSLGGNVRVFADIEAPSLRDLAAVLSHCDYYVGNEGGPRHIAEAVSVSTVSVFSPSADRQEWLPGDRPNHLGVEWRDVKPLHPEPKYEFADEMYYQLYNAIKPEHVTPLIDQVVAWQQTQT